MHYINITVTYIIIETYMGNNIMKPRCKMSGLIV